MPKVLVVVLAGLVTSQLALLLTTMYLHRTLSHRSVTMSPGLDFASRAVLWLSTGIRPREWAAVHRRHHAYTDVLGDPHSPFLEGYWKVQLYNVGLYKKAAHDAETLRKYSRDIKVDKWDKVLFDHGFVGLGIGYCIFWALFGWSWALVAAGVHVVSLPAPQLRHQRHRPPLREAGLPGLATNNQWLALLTWGEGLHSNHHAAPTSAKFSFYAPPVRPRVAGHQLLQEAADGSRCATMRIHLTAAGPTGWTDRQREREPELV